MIVTELTIVFLLFVWGLSSGVIASCLNVFGRASRPARAVADTLIPISVAAAYFFGLYLAASGEFRVYSLVAFAVGAVISSLFCVRFYPVFKRFARRLFSPLISLEKRVEKRLAERLAPLLEKMRRKRAARKEKREEEKRRRRKEKRKIREEKMRERKGKESEKRARKRRPKRPERAAPLLKAK